MRFRFRNHGKKKCSAAGDRFSVTVIGMRVIALFFLFVFAALPALSVPVAPPALSKQHLLQLLHKQGFSGPLKGGDIELKNLGLLTCSEESYRVYYFSWAEIRPGGRPGHGQQRLVFIGAGERYAGSYEIEDPPVRVHGDAILLSYDTNDEIRCVNGALPEDGLIDGKSKPQMR